MLVNLRLFLTILEKGSLAATGRETGLTPATVSERLAALEAHYGTRLLNRTTRAISPTEEGRALAEGALRLLSESDALDTRIKYGIDRVAGPIRLSATVDLGRTRIAPVLDAFQTAHPDVSFGLHLHDGCVDITGQGLAPGCGRTGEQAPL
nr:LysR family transcriptional regulator [Szabonella alba]